MTTSAPGPLCYSNQPPSSLAVCERLGEQGVRVSIPPPVHRTMVKIILIVEILGCLMGPPLLVVAFLGWLPQIPFLMLLASTLTAVAYATLAITLWMGFRWTIVEAGPEGLRVELRGLLIKRQHFYAREQIGDLRKMVSLLIFDPHGRQIGKIDATDPREEIWLMEVLRHALNLPRA